MSTFGISFIQLRRFLVLAEELHFSRAAERLGISQPLLSEQVKCLEQTIRFKLFDRSSRRVQITPAGLLFKDRVSLLLMGLEDGVKTARDVQDGGTTPIRIGYTDEFTQLLLPDLIAGIKIKDEDAGITLTSATVPELMDKLQTGLIDLALLSPMSESPPGPDWEVILFEPLLLSLGVSEGHRLAGRNTVTIGEIADEKFIECPADGLSASEVIVDRLFAQHGIKRKIVQRLDDPHLAASLAAAGVGSLIASFSGVSPPAGLNIIPLKEPRATLSCGAVCRKSDQTHLLKLCRSYLQERSPTIHQKLAV